MGGFLRRLFEGSKRAWAVSYGPPDGAPTATIMFEDGRLWPGFWAREGTLQALLRGPEAQRGQRRQRGNLVCAPQHHGTKRVLPCGVRPGREGERRRRSRRRRLARWAGKGVSQSRLAPGQVLATYTPPEHFWV